MVARKQANDLSVRAFNLIMASVFVVMSILVIGAFLVIRNYILNQQRHEQEIQRINAELEARVRERTRQIYDTERRFGSLIENSSDAIVMSTAEGAIKYMSPGAERMLGKSLDNDRSQRLNIVHPDDVQMMQKMMEGLLDHPGQSVNAIYRLKNLEGNYFWAEGVVTNLLNHESVNAIVTNFRDISERKVAEEKLEQSEQRFRSLIENSADMLTQFDVNGKLIYCSPSVKKVMGYDLEDLADKAVDEYTHPDDVELAQTVFIMAFENPGVSYPFIGRQKTKESHWIWLEGSVTNWLNEPAVNAIVCNFRDITDRKNAETEIKKLNAELEDRVRLRTKELQLANHELESFSYSVSHDLRAPLRAIHGYTQILSNEYFDKLDAEAQRMMGNVMSNAKRMGTLIDDLLAFSRLGRKELVKSPMNMEQLCLETWNELIALEGKRKVELKLHQLPNINADSGTMKQVWLNLLSNALKYSRAQELTVIEIGSEQKGDFVTYYVKDNGAGFDMRYVDKLFGVFQRLHTQDEFEGTGVGLAIVERIINKHGGTVRAEGIVNEGAAFYFTLPK